MSRYQRSLYNVDRLSGKPWWDKDEMSNKRLYNVLTQYWKEIKEEGLKILNEKGYFKDESENLKDTGQWKQFELYARGVKNIKNCERCPTTCKIIDSIPEAKTCKRGQVKFSVIHPGTHVWPHCGPTNCRLRVHLGLKVPPNTFIRVANETRYKILNTNFLKSHITYLQYFKLQIVLDSYWLEPPSWLLHIHQNHH